MRSDAAVGGPTRAELEEERDFLLRSLRDLDSEHGAGDIDDDDHGLLRSDYAARAAAVLRALDDPDGRPPPLVTGAAGGRRVVGRSAAPRRWRPLVTAAAVVAAASLAGFTVATTSGERLTGQEATGSLPAGTVDRITQAQELVSKGRILDAVKLYDEILADDPENPVALSHRGWLVSRAGLIDEGLASIDRAIAANPGYPDAHFFRAMILWQAKDDPAGAAEEFGLVLSNRPPPELVAYVQDARGRALTEAATRAAAGQPLPPG